MADRFFSLQYSYWGASFEWSQSIADGNVIPIGFDIISGDALSAAVLSSVRSTFQSGIEFYNYKSINTVTYGVSEKLTSWIPDLLWSWDSYKELSATWDSFRALALEPVQHALEEQLKGYYQDSPPPFIAIDSHDWAEKLSLELVNNISLSITNIHSDPSYGRVGTIHLVRGGSIESDGNDRIFTNENVKGSGGDDIYILGPESLFVTPGTGNDKIYASSPTTLVRYDGYHGQYSFSQSPVLGLVVADSIQNRDGEDQLFNVKRIGFNDITIASDVDGNAGQAYRIYQAAFDRVPDRGGVSYWTSRLDNGDSLVSIADRFLWSDEFRERAGGDLDEEAFVSLLYNNVLDRDPDQQGFEYWRGSLESGTSRAEVLAAFSESNENKANVIGVIANRIELDPVWI